MFEKQLDLFEAKLPDRPRPDLGDFDTNLLEAAKSVLQEKLGIKDESDWDKLAEEFASRNEQIGPYDLVRVTSAFKKLAGTSQEKPAQRHAEKVVIQELARLARRLGLPVFEPAFPGTKERTTDRAASDQVRKHNSPHKGGSYLSHSHNEEEERS